MCRILYGLADMRAVSLVLTLLICSIAYADDWPAIRGGGDGVVKSEGILSASDEIELKVRWRRPIGSGYSSVVVVDGRCVTMNKDGVDGADDVVSCYDASTGAELWKVSVGPTFKGANGSFDGPLSTPLIHDGHVFALSARGRFVCVDLKSGEQTWSRELAKDEQSKLPMYGFTTSPILAGDTVILAIGGENRLVIGVDPANGKTKWATGADMVSSQTPVLYSAAGREVVLLSAGRNLTAINPSDGTELFAVPHEGGNGSAVTPVDLGNGKVLLTVDDSFSNAFEITADGDKLAAKKVWSERSIKNTYNIPVRVGDNVFGFSTRFLTCVDPQTGKPRWKARKPGDGFLIAVNDKLIITTKKGSVHVANAGPSAYDELAGLKVFKDLNWSLPAYADGSIFSRSFGEIARIDVVKRGGEMVAATSEKMPLGTKFKAFLSQVESAGSAAAKNSRADDYLKSIKSFPITEGDVIHFVYRGECQDAAVACDVFGARQERRMVRVPGTDVFYYSMKLPRDQRANYVFLIDYKPQPDPRNKRSTVSSMYAGEMEFAMRLRNEKPLTMSWFAMPDWKEPKFIAELNKSDRKLQGKLVQHEITAKDGKTKLPVSVYVPAGYDDTDKAYRTIYVAGGEFAETKVVPAADAIYATDEDLRRALLVFFKAPYNPMVPGPSPADQIAKFVVPFIDKNYRTITSRDGRTSLGFGFTCGEALGLVTNNPNQFSAVSVQSPLIFDAAQEATITAFNKLEKSTRVHIEWGSYDMFNPHENWDIRKIGKTLSDGMVSSKLVVTSQQVNDSTDWRSWIGRLDVVLRFHSKD